MSLFGKKVNILHCCNDLFLLDLSTLNKNRLKYLFLQHTLGI